ncbi:MAG: PEP-CTERM sorting domain-containing protein [Alphaproteobacteria bacterium]|nr:PEP-CTERM sorting domain-containing protein [Alphaproteobacteria bacterium]
MGGRVLQNRSQCRLWGVSFLCLVAVCSAASADLTLDLAYIGAPGNTADNTGFGAVSYPYYISTYEVTVAQYADFLNSVARSDPYGLYSSSMASDPLGASILRSGSDGSYAYTPVSGTEGQPVRWVSWYDGLRLCNWLNNGQGNSSTETGSYDMAEGAWALRSSTATWVLPTEDEWYKAAYYDPDTGTYYDYPNGTDDVPAEPTDGTTPRVFNFGDDPYWQGGVYFTSTGQTTGASPYGTYDQGGNVREWMETRSVQFPDHMIRGGAFTEPAMFLYSGTTQGTDPDTEGYIGFRLIHIIPEPSTVMLLILGGLACLLFKRR